MFLSCVFRRLAGVEVVARRRAGLLGVMLIFAGLGLGGCAQRPQEVAAASHGKEYFPSSIYGRESPRVIADGQPVPRGGGRYMVGKPYTIAGRTYVPSENRRTQIGMASWYGDAFHGRLTANREIYDRDGFTAASPTMPLPCYARVTNLRNNYSMIVRVNDRGPYASDRIMDVSRRVAEALDYKRYGTTKVKVEYVGRASLDGSDDARLVATLRTNGPARWQSAEPTVLAEVETPVARVALVVPPSSPPARYREPQRERRDARYVDDDRPSRRFAPREEMDERHERHRVVASRHGDRAGRGQEMVGRDRPTGSRFADDGFRRDRDSVSPRHAAFKPRDMAPEPHQTRIARLMGRPAMMPPSRPLDLATIPGAASQIHARHAPSHLRMARARDE